MAQRPWKALASKEVKSCEAIMFEKLCKCGAHCFVIVVAKEDLAFEMGKKKDEGK